MLSGTLFINPFLVSDQIYHWECNKGNEGKALDLNLNWVTGFRFRVRSRYSIGANSRIDILP